MYDWDEYAKGFTEARYWIERVDLKELVSESVAAYETREGYYSDFARGYDDRLIEEVVYGER